jgi:L-ascorbate metabolism protein UlaG (beta-lactamase superfamily)
MKFFKNKTGKPKRSRRTRMIMWGTTVAICGLVGILCISACASMGRPPKGESLERVRSSQHYRENEFKNNRPTGVMLPGSFWQTMTQWFSGDQIRVPKSPPPIVRLDNKSFRQPPTSGLRITWLGHNTVMIEIDGYRILTDPVFSKRISPISWMGPKRFHDVPITIDELPEIDAVVISHDHYDHLDHQSIVELASKTRLFYMPLGVGSHLESWGIPKDKIVEMGWWQENTVLGQLKLIATPARHFSGRGPFDRNKTHWAAWAIIGPEHRIFLGGDTGLCDSFKYVGEKFGPFNVTLMPIGSYGPTWPEIHMTPEQAVQAHLDVKGGLLIPIHWGTFNLAFHSWTEPAERLLVETSRTDVACSIPKAGEMIDGDTPPQIVRWWPDIPWEQAKHTAKTDSDTDPVLAGAD